MENKEQFIYVTGEVIFKSINIFDLTSDKFDNTPMVRFAIKKPTIELPATMPNVEYLPKWVESPNQDYINVKSKFALTVYESGHQTNETVFKHDNITVCYKITSKCIYPIAIRINSRNNYSPFDR